MNTNTIPENHTSPSPYLDSFDLKIIQPRMYNDDSSTIKTQPGTGFEILFVSVMILIWLCSISIALGIYDWIRAQIEHAKFKKRNNL